MSERADRVVERSLDVAEAIARVSHPSAGGIATFVGVVRDHNDGRAVTMLEYHAYVEMAEKELLAIEDEILTELPGVRVFAMHRIGSLEVGDTAVVCAASSVHRGEAFRAVRQLIDRVKARLPIWKREHGPDGPYWVGWEDARCEAHNHSHDHDVHDR